MTKREVPSSECLCFDHRRLLDMTFGDYAILKRCIDCVWCLLIISYLMCRNQEEKEKWFQAMLPRYLNSPFTWASLPSRWGIHRPNLCSGWSDDDTEECHATFIQKHSMYCWDCDKQRRYISFSCRSKEACWKHYRYTQSPSKGASKTTSSELGYRRVVLSTLQNIK